jgi:RNA polymerase sigma-70 factor, ECF subfamily
MVAARLTVPAHHREEESSCLDAFQNEFDYVCRTLRRLGVHPQDLEDELHEVFLVLNRKWTEYDQSRPLRPYLFGIAFRVVAAHKRRRGREVPSEAHQAIDDSPQADELVQSSRARELVLRALERVPLPRRAVLVMHDIDEIPMRKVAEALSVPMFTGYSRLRKARREFEAAVTALQKGTYRP